MFLLIHHINCVYFDVNLLIMSPHFMGEICCFRQVCAFVGFEWEFIKTLHAYDIS